MRNIRMLTAIPILCLMISCAPMPKRVGSRGAIKQKELTFLENGPVSREDVLLHLGQPEDTIQNERIYDYKWIGAWNYVSLIIQSGSIEVQNCNVLRFRFDELGTVQDVYIHSYKPKAPLSSNRECIFDQTAASKLNVLHQRVSADYAFITEGRTSRQEVLQRLGWADVGLKEPGIFWFRWAASSAGLEAKSDRVILPGAAGIKGTRKWKVHNLLVEFDKSNVVARVVNVKDQDLIPKLIDWSRRSSQALPKLSSLADNRYSATTDGRQGHNWLMSMDVDALKFWDGLRRSWYTVPYDKILSVEMKKATGIHPQYTLHFMDKHLWGKELNVSINPDELLTVLKYMTQRNSLLVQ